MGNAIYRVDLERINHLTLYVLAGSPGEATDEANVIVEGDPDIWMDGGDVSVHELEAIEAPAVPGDKDLWYRGDVLMGDEVEGLINEEESNGN